MVSLPVYDCSGVQIGQYEIDPRELAPRISKQLLHDAVVMYQASLRQGTHKSKTRGQVAGSTRKMYRQKGTGNARAGSRRSGVRRGGGHIHAVSPRDYSYRLPRKALRTATRMAIASKILDQQLVIVDELSFVEPKTQQMATVLKALGLAGASTLVATAQRDVNVFKSARNIARVSVLPVSDLNAWSVLRPAKMLITRAALETIRKQAAVASSEEV